jgi:serine/threonine-protein kinase
MKLFCTRPGCPKPENHCPELDDTALLSTVQQKYCITCGMPLILDSRYLPIQLLGRGGFGAAFLARDRRLPGLRKCVVKQFQPLTTMTPEQLAMAQTLFEREGETLAELGNRHPQIPDLYAFFPIAVPHLRPGEVDKLFYLVQEFIDGQTLEQKLKCGESFSEADVSSVLQAMLHILEFVHGQGVIHRDIKPSNIMCDANGQLYLLDFGAVKQVTQLSKDKSSTGIYTPGYAPPEQMAGSEVFQCTDLYALAVTCLVLLTGKQPLELFNSYYRRWDIPRETDVSAFFLQLLEHLLEPTPSDRPQSAAAVLAALQAIPQPTCSGQSTSPEIEITNPEFTDLSLPILTPPNSPIASTLLSPQEAVAAPVAASPGSPPRRRSPQAPLSLPQLLGYAAFTGVEGGLFAIVLLSLVKNLVLSSGLWGLILGGLIFCQSRRIIEGWDLPVFGGMTLILVLLFPTAHSVVAGSLAVLFLAVMGGCLAVTITALFRLIYQFLRYVL